MLSYTPETMATIERSPIHQINSPHLRFIYKSLKLLEPQKQPDGTILRWQNLYKKVASFHDGFDLFSSIEAVVENWVEQKIPALKKEIFSIREFDDEELARALVDGYKFDALSNRRRVSIKGDRTEILLITMAHMVNRVSTVMYKNILLNASNEDLSKLNLNKSTAQLTADLLDASLPVDPLYIRFKVFVGLTGKPPKGAYTEALFLPHDETPYSFSKLFPREAMQISENYRKIVEKGGDWVQLPGGQEFKSFLEIYSQYYRETDPKKAVDLREEADKLSVAYHTARFPIFVTGPGDESVNAPNIDPEKKISLLTPETQEFSLKSKRVQDGFERSLDVIGFKDQASLIHAHIISGLVVLRGFGINLSFNALAQGEPCTQIFLNYQNKNHMQGFAENWLRKYINRADFVFGDFIRDSNSTLIKSMFQAADIGHELDHVLFPEGMGKAPPNGNGEPFGNGDVAHTMEEISAEMIFRSLIPRMIELSAVEGTKKQWAMMLTAISLKYLSETKGVEDDYFIGAVFSLNELFNQDVIEIRNGKIHINDADRYFDVVNEQVQDIIRLYRKAVAPDEKTGKKWIDMHCKPNRQVRHLLKKI